MARTIHLAIFNSPIFPAHWALWIPHLDTANIGKLLEADGDAANSFEICFHRNYDLGGDSRRHQILPPGEVDDDLLVDVKGDRTQTVDRIAHDRFEEITLSVAAPKPSLVSAAAPGPKKRVSDHERPAQRDQYQYKNRYYHPAAPRCCLCGLRQERRIHVSTTCTFMRFVLDLTIIIQSIEQLSRSKPCLIYNKVLILGSYNLYS
ncbi:hypothetical protein P280DRAFT_461099, partial [Massarina eburnea CBS 473.64]